MPTFSLNRISNHISAKTLLGMLILSLLWGISIPITKIGLADIEPITFTALRFLIAVPFLFIFANGRRKLPIEVIPKVALIGFVGIGIGNLSQSFGIAYASASVSTIISATIPVFVVILAAIRLGQLVSFRQGVGVIAAFLGVALVAFGQNGDVVSASQSTPLGIILVLLSAIAIALYYVLSVEVSIKYGTITVVVWSSFCGFVFLIPFAAWEISEYSHNITFTALSSAIYLGLCVSAIGLYLWLWLLRTVPARIAASAQFLQPVFGVISSALIFGDDISLLFLFGGTLVLVGMMVAILSHQNSNNQKPL